MSHEQAEPLPSLMTSSQFGISFTKEASFPSVATRIWAGSRVPEAMLVPLSLAESASLPCREETYPDRLSIGIDSFQMSVYRDKKLS